MMEEVESLIRGGLLHSCRHGLGLGYVRLKIIYYRLRPERN